MANKIVCIKCKKEKSVRPDVYKKRVAKFGSEKKLLESYLCLNCRPKKKDEKKEKPKEKAK